MNVPRLLPAGIQDASADLRAVYAAWAACRRDGELLPRLSDYLDAPAFKQQPQIAIADVYSLDDVRFRLFGGGLASMAGGDHTRKGTEAVLSPDAKAAARPLTWAAVQQPCGYRASMIVNSSSGLVAASQSIYLPLQPAKGVPFCMMAMVTLPDSNLGQLLARQDSFVSALTLDSWIDIGAGVPPSPHSPSQTPKP